LFHRLKRNSELFLQIKAKLFDMTWNEIVLARSHSNKLSFPLILWFYRFFSKQRAKKCKSKAFFFHALLKLFDSLGYLHICSERGQKNRIVLVKNPAHDAASRQPRSHSFPMGGKLRVIYNNTRKSFRQIDWKGMTAKLCIRRHRDFVSFDACVGRRTNTLALSCTTVKDAPVLPYLLDCIMRGFHNNFFLPPKDRKMFECIEAAGFIFVSRDNEYPPIVSVCVCIP
jgi:hypothetical protein